MAVDAALGAFRRRIALFRTKRNAELAAGRPEIRLYRLLQLAIDTAQLARCLMGHPSLFDTAAGKRCTRCKEFKSVDDFAFADRKCGKLQPQCRTCSAAISRMQRQKRRQNGKAQAYRIHRRSHNKALFLRRNFGIDIEMYNAMLKSQGGVCAICGRPERNTLRSGEQRMLAVDHCHATGQIRGLLCGNCNRAIGCLEDREDFLLAAIAYLRKHKCVAG